MVLLRLAEAGRLPDTLIRLGIRRLLRQRLREVTAGGVPAVEERNRAFVAAWSQGPIAALPERANAQHYEVAPAFYQRVLGRHMKYSCGLWERGVAGLDAAEERMLARTAERAQLADGMRILDLGCGWGSLALWIAERFPASRVVALSNAKAQREHILARRDAAGLRNVEVLTADVNRFAPDGRFDRVVSVEMFEHVRNHGLLLSRIARWLEPGGRLFVHHFSHRVAAYPYEAQGDDDWMARMFFSGGIMPSDDLLDHHARDLVVEQRWRVNGLHYHHTCEAWLRRQEQQRDALLPVLADVYGRAHAPLWFERWRLFFLACSELFRFGGGEEWFVTHARLARPEEAR